MKIKCTDWYVWSRGRFWVVIPRTSVWSCMYWYQLEKDLLSVTCIGYFCFIVLSVGGRELLTAFSSLSRHGPRGSILFITGLWTLNHFSTDTPMIFVSAFGVSALATFSERLPPIQREVDIYPTDLLERFPSPQWWNHSTAEYDKP